MKYIYSVVLVLAVMFSVSYRVYAVEPSTPYSQVKAIIEILKTLDISQNKIDAIVEILETPDEDMLSVLDSISEPVGGCEDNNKYNTVDGSKCNSYVAPEEPILIPKRPATGAVPTCNSCRGTTPASA